MELAQNTQVLGVKLMFNQILPELSKNCNSISQALIVRDPIYVNMIISENKSLQEGFGVLLYDGIRLTSVDFSTSVQLTNQGIDGQLKLLGFGAQAENGALSTIVNFSGINFYLNEIITDNITPTTGSQGTAVMLVSLSAKHPNYSLCALKGQVVNATLLP